LLVTPSSVQQVLVRPCFEQDLTQVRLIYGHHVTTGIASFELDPPDNAEMKARWSKTVAKGWPFLVATPADDLGRILGFAYARPYHERPAYAHTFEDSIYVAPGSERRGVGKALLSGLLRELQQIEVQQVIALIGDSANTASITLHQRLGFRHVGVLHNVGAKFGRWIDVVIMQRSIPLHSNSG
jgi:phosphinothricin acetyltransferase